jgi:hypothetical protein
MGRHHLSYLNLAGEWEDISGNFLTLMWEKDERHEDRLYSLTCVAELRHEDYEVARQVAELHEVEFIIGPEGPACWCPRFRGRFVCTNRGLLSGIVMFKSSGEIVEDCF